MAGHPMQRESMCILTYTTVEKSNIVLISWRAKSGIYPIGPHSPSSGRVTADSLAFIHLTCAATHLVQADRARRTTGSKIFAGGGGSDLRGDRVSPVQPSLNLVFTPRSRASMGTAGLRECMPFTPIPNKTKPLSPSLDRSDANTYRLARSMANTL